MRYGRHPAGDGADLAKVDEKDVCLALVARCRRQPGQFLTLIGDKNFRGKQFEADLAALDATIIRPRRADEKRRATTPPTTASTAALRPASELTPHPRPTDNHEPHLAPIRQRIESIYWTAKDILTLERHGARTLHGLRTRIACRFLALTAAIALNHQLGLPSRSLAQYIA